MVILAPLASRKILEKLKDEQPIILHIRVEMEQGKKYATFAQTYDFKTLEKFDAFFSKVQDMIAELEEKEIEAGKEVAEDEKNNIVGGSGSPVVADFGNG